MPGAPQTVILGGGIKKGAPFTVNTLPVITGISPPTVSDSVAKQSVNGRSIAFGSGAAFGAANDQVAIGTNVIFTGTVTGIVGLGNNIASNVTVGFSPPVLIGNGITCNTAGAVIINTGLTSLTHAAGSASIAIGSPNDIGLGCVSIGAGITTTVNQSRNVLIGFGVFCSSGAGSDNTLIGAQAQGTGLTQVVGIGSAINFGSNALSGSVIIGYNSSIQGAKSNCIVIGPQNIAGSASPFIYLSAGLNDATIPANSFIVGGPNNPMNNVLIGRGQTHTATLGGLTIRGTNGITTNNLDMGALTIIAPLSTGNAANGHIIFQTGAIAGAGNAQQAATTQFRVLASAGGAGVASVDIANVTNGAAANVGTLNNAPAAGDPTFWVPVAINGIVKHIPAW